MEEVQALRDRVDGLTKTVAQLSQLRSSSSNNGSAAPLFPGLNTGGGSSSTTAAARLQRAAADAAQRPMAATRVTMTELVSPAECNGLGICYGGAVLSWIDVCAGIAARSLARAPCVTLSLDAVHFFRPCHANCIALVAAMINRTFGSSMEVGVRVEEEDPATGVRVHCCSAYLTFVALPPSGGGPKPALPAVVPVGRYQEAVHAEAARRREARLAERQRAQQDPALRREVRQRSGARGRVPSMDPVCPSVH